jgi:WD40 repeat protein
VTFDTPWRVLEAKEAVEALAFSPDGKRLAWGTSAGDLHLWDLNQGNTFAAKGPAAVRAMAFVAAGKTWLIAFADGTLQARDAETGAPLPAPPVKLEGVLRALAYSPEAKMWLVSKTSKDGKMEKLIWHDEGQMFDRGKSDLAIHDIPVWSLAFSSDGQRLATGGEDEFVRLWDPATGQFVKCIKVGGKQIPSLAFAHDRDVAVACGKCVELWDFNTEELRMSSPAEHGEIRRVACSRDGSLLAVGDGPIVKVWAVAKVPQLHCRAILTGQTQPVQALAFSEDGKLLATGGKDGTIRLWEVTHLTPVRGGDW